MIQRMLHASAGRAGERTGGFRRVAAPHGPGGWDDLRRVREAGRPVPCCGFRVSNRSTCRHDASFRCVAGAPLPPTVRVEAAIRSAGYEPGTPSWLTSEVSTRITVALSWLAIGTVFLAGTFLGVGGLVGDLASPSRGGLLLVLVLGLTAGFSTCMAMVGGLVLGFSASHAAARTRDGQPLASFVTRMRPQVAFNVGRIVGFGVLGAALGSLGSVVGLPTRMIGALALAVAVVMFLLGVRLTGVSPRMAAWSPRLPAGLAGLLGLDAAAGRPYSHTRTALVGAATFFLPCGFSACWAAAISVPWQDYGLRK